MSSPFTSGGQLASPPSRAPQAPPQQPQPAPQPQAPAVPDAITGRVLGTFNDGPLCGIHFPGRAELARLVHQARSGRPAPFVGLGHEYTALMCACLGPGDHPWRLGDHVARLAHLCLRGEHDRCLDRSCECDCGSHEERAAALTQSDGQLAAALREISASMGGQVGAEVLEELRALRAKVAALEAAKDAPEPKAAARKTPASA